ncbi:hypothetical protein Tco_0093145 [Tanacetum coccineum]
MFLNLWRYKVVRPSDSNPMIQPEPEGSTQGYPLVSVEVLRILKDGGEVLILQSQKHKLELEKNKVEAEAALLKAQPLFPNVEQLNELLVESTQAKLKTLDALPSLLLNVIKALNKFAEVLESTSTKAGDQSVPSEGQADTMPAEREKDTNQATIS